MQVSIHKKSLLPVISLIVFFIFYYLYILIRIDIRLVYHGTGYVPFPVFFKGIDFFKEFLDYPGRITEYIYAFLSQLYYFHHLGTFVVTVLTLFICLLTGKLVTAMNGIKSSAVIFVPVILILIMYNEYFNYLLLILVVFISLLFFLFYIQSNKYKGVFRTVLFLILFSILFYTSINSILLFILLCSTFEIFIKRKPLIGISYIISSSLILYIASIYILYLGLADTYLGILPYSSRYWSENTTISWAFYFFFPVLALWLGLWQILIRIEKLQKIDTIFKRYSEKEIRHIFSLSILTIITASAALLTFDKAENTNLKINYYSRNEMWKEVIEETDQMSLKTYNFLINHEINKTLYYEGRLLYDMFSYPQNLKSLLTYGTFDPDIEGAALSEFILNLLSEFILISDTCFKLGLINFAEHTAHEALESIGERPIILKQLFLINVVKEKIDVAKIFLNLLSRDLIYGKEAEQYRKLLEEKDYAYSDAFILQKRAAMLKKDFDTSIDIGLLFEGLLDNQTNRMAFEYLMAYYLLSFQLDKVAENIGRLDEYDYPDIPRHIEEALIIFSNLPGNKVDLHGKKLSTESIQKYQNFTSTAHYFRNNPNEGLRYIFNNFGKTYYFQYFLYSIGQRKQ